MKVLAKHGLIAGLLTVASTAWGQQSVHVVDDDGGPGVDFTELQPAVDAAQEGDVILVKAGTYSDLVVRGKSVVVGAEVGHEVRIFGTLLVEGISSGKSVVLRGIDVVVPLRSDAPIIQSSAGSIVLEECDVRNGNLGQFARGANGMNVLNSHQVTFVRCSLEGSTGGHPKGAGDALLVSDSTVHLYDCSLQGGVGALGGPNDGGHGAVVDDGFLFASGSFFLSADGGNGVTIVTQFGTFCTDGGDGGSGLYLHGTNGRAVLLDDTLVGAFGGYVTQPMCTPGVDGQPTTVVSGVLQTLTGAARGFAVASPLRENELGDIAFAGEPDDLVFLLVSLYPAGGYAPLLHGSLLVDPAPPALLFTIRDIPPGGTLSLPVRAPVLPAGIEGAVLHYQAIYLATNGAAYAGPSSAGIILDRFL